MNDINYQVTLIPMSKIFCDTTFNCRGPIQPYEVVDLARDIKDTGLQTPITVQPYNKLPGYEYRILAGHRRYVAHLVNAEDAIQCFIRPDIIDELDARDYNLKENLFRQDLNILQEAKALEPYFQRRLTLAQVAKRLNRSQGWVEPRRQLLNLPPDIQDQAAKGVINQQHVKSLYQLRNTPEKMYELFISIKEAKERGDKVVVIKKVIDVLEITKIKVPAKHEVFGMLDIVANMITNKTGRENFGARCLAYAAGAISLAEVYLSLKRECDQLGLPFDPPKEIKVLLNGPDNGENDEEVSVEAPSELVSTS